jgi:hypothetical protein
MLNEEALLVYDGQGMNIQGRDVSTCISRFMLRVTEPNNSLRRVVDTALFVASRAMPGIQLADLTASLIRQYEQYEMMIS